MLRGSRAASPDERLRCRGLAGLAVPQTQELPFFDRSVSTTNITLLPISYFGFLTLKEIMYSAFQNVCILKAMELIKSLKQNSSCLFGVFRVSQFLRLSPSASVSDIQGLSSSSDGQNLLAPAGDLLWPRRVRGQSPQSHPTPSSLPAAGP